MKLRLPTFFLLLLTTTATFANSYRLSQKRMQSYLSSSRFQEIVDHITFLQDDPRKALKHFIKNSEIFVPNGLSYSETLKLFAGHLNPFVLEQGDRLLVVSHAEKLYQVGGILTIEGPKVTARVANNTKIYFLTQKNLKFSKVINFYDRKNYPGTIFPFYYTGRDVYFYQGSAVVRGILDGVAVDPKTLKARAIVRYKNPRFKDNPVYEPLRIKDIFPIEKVFLL